MKPPRFLMLLLLAVICTVLMSCADMPDTAVSYHPDGSVSLSTLRRPPMPVYPAK